MLLATPELSDQALITASASSGALTVTNLQTQSLKEVYRAADASSVTIVIDLRSSQAFNLVSLIAHSGSSRSYGRVRAANSEAALVSSPIYDSTNLPLRSHQTGYDSAWASGVSNEQYGAYPKNMFLLFLPSAVTARFIRIDISDPNSSYLDIGRLYVSKAWQPLNNMNYGLSEGIIDPSRKTRTVSAELSVAKKTKYRWAEFTLSFASETEMYDNAHEIERLRGRTEDVLFIQDPAAKANLQRRSIYGTMENLQPIVNSTFNIFEKSFRIEELTP